MQGFRMILLGSLLFLNNSQILAQLPKLIRGTVYAIDDKSKKDYIEGAVVSVPGTDISTATQKDGKFTIRIPDSIAAIVISFTGYLPDTVSLVNDLNALDIELTEPHHLKEVVISEKIKSTEIGMLDPIKMEKIGLQELAKAACCNLSESFETTPSVDVAFTDAVTGYTQIKLLGLASSNTLITRENIPDAQGLASITGLSFTPGVWIEGMQLSKGTGSVVNGYGGVAGQINVELQKPFDGEKWLFNIYQSAQGHSEANVNYRHKFGNRLGTNLMVHANAQWLKLDQNKDGFLDQPLGNQFNILNRWIYTGATGWMFQAGIKFVYAEGVGGEWNYKPGDPQTAGNPWGYHFTTARLEDWVKIAKVFDQRPGTSVGLQLSNVNHDQDGNYGPREYIGLQNSYYANLIFQTYINNTNHVIKTGLSTLVDDYKEQFDNIYYSRNELIPGIFSEYAWHYSDKFNAVAGLRYDYDNMYGGFVTPRLHLRYAPFKKTVIRASIGRARRTANIFAENIGLMASNREFNLTYPGEGKGYGLNPEVSWNTGYNITRKFKIGLRDAVLSLDYYYTWFQNQVVVDIEEPGVVNFYNLSGQSFSHSFQAQMDYELIHNFNLRLAYRYLNVMTTYDGVLKEKPFVPANRTFLNMGYETRNKWKFDYTIQLVGTQRTPGVTHVHAGITPGSLNQSPAFLLMNVQATKVFSNVFEIYGGCENIMNYMQHDAVAGASNPYGPTFDASLIWGPLMGRTIYLGIRCKMK